MARVDNLIAELKLLAAVETTDGIADTDLKTYFLQAVKQHDRNLDTSDALVNLAPEEEEPVLTLGWIKVCLVRAAKAAKESSVQGVAGYGRNVDSPYAKQMSMAEKLSDRYYKLCERLRLTTNRVVVGQLFVRDQIFDALVPLLQTANQPRVLLSLATDTSGLSDTLNAVVLTWTAENASDFYDLRIYCLTGNVPIFQQWNNTSGTGVPCINDSAVPLLISERNPSVNTVRITDLDLRVVNRFLIVLRSRSGKYSYSNELVVAATPSDPAPPDGTKPIIVGTADSSAGNMGPASPMF